MQQLLLVLLLLLLVAIPCFADIEKITLEEAELLGKDPTYFASKEVQPEQAKHAVKQLEEEEAKIKQTLQEEKVRQAQLQWERLSPAQKKLVTEMAHKQAEERRKALEENIRVLERQDLEAKLRQELAAQAEIEQAEDAKQETIKLQAEQAEFEARRAAYRAQQAEKRTTITALVFWLTLLFLGVIGTKLCTAFKQQKIE